MKTLQQPNAKQQKIIEILLQKKALSSSEIFAELKSRQEEGSLVTVKRTVSEMTTNGILIQEGAARATTYQLSVTGRLMADIDAKTYCAVDPDQRFGLRQYSFDLFKQLPEIIFTHEEATVLETATAEYEKQTRELSPTLKKKELERLIIELSWKSSKIEGNTYTLLDTERLLMENHPAAGKDRKETQMIINHKDAFTFIYEHSDQFVKMNRTNLEKVHHLLVRNLEVETGLRSKPVGVTGSVYRPLDNIHQIREAIESLGQAIDRMQSPYAKALIALLGVSYIQPFEDGNKRTARLFANALLLAHHRSALSYRSVDENEYREAILVFYELNAIVPFKKIFVTQYDFAARNYAVK